MFSAFVVSSSAPDLETVVADLAAAGVAVLGSGTPLSMVEDVIRSAPDLLVCYEPVPQAALFAATQSLDTASPRPTVVFTSDPDAEKIERATRSGVHAYVVNGYATNRLRSVLHVAQARFRTTQALREALADVNNRFAERKLVDRAKGIVMRLRDLSEEEAYAALRSAAMKSKRRIGQVAQQVIDAARYGEAVNRSGQLRMHSQRLVKLYALIAADPDPEAARRLFEEAVAQVDATLASLGRILSKPTFGDLLDAVSDPWAVLKAALAGAPSVARLPAIDGLAERLLGGAEQLTANLENAGFAAALRVINVSGRQRMLCQRLAKQALLAGLLPAGTPTPDLPATERAFTQAMTYLHAVPLSTEAIRTRLASAAETWTALREAVPAARDVEGRRAVLALSESLLGTFETLTEDYERNIQELMG